MQMFIIAIALFGLAAAAPPYSPYPEQSHRPQAEFERNARIISYDSAVNEDSYRYSYETENGIKAQEEGREVDGIEAQGGFQYTGDDGQVYSVSYTAGKDGALFQGAHLPVAPPTPEAILRALEQNARDEAAGIIDDGSYNPGKYGGGAQLTPQQNYARAQAQASGNFRQPYKF